MLSTETKYYCTKSWKDGLYYLQESGRRKDESDLTGYKTVNEAWDSLGVEIDHPRRYQICLSHGSGSFSYLYVVQEECESQEDLEQKIKNVYWEDYAKQMKCRLRWTPYTVRRTVKVKEMRRGIAKTLRGGNHFSLKC
jgi:hypothetical protein